MSIPRFWYNGAVMTTGKHFAAFALILIAALSISGCGERKSAANGKMIVAAGIAPMANFAKQVGGDLVQVELMVPPGQNPHTYQPEPRQMKALSEARVLVLNGLGLEFWADKAVQAASNPNLMVVKTGEGIATLADDDDHLHPGGNPHVWVSPVLAIRQVGAVRDAFEKADPEHTAEYTANASRFIGELKKLDADIRDQVKNWKTKGFITLHPSWLYFAHEYGLEEVASIERSPGREPTPSEMREVIDLARKLHAKAIFAEPQFSAKAAQVVASETGAKVVFLDPYGEPPDYDYVKTMRANLEKMSEALR